VDGHPSVRLVLLRGLDERGLAFFTNYESRKGVELAANARAALLFPWHAMRRQVRIEGPVERLTAAESDAYFASRPLDARFSAAASPQSAVIGTRAELERRVRELQSQHPAGDIPRPEFWGGYRVRPERWEFWQARRHRLHDRVSYQREDRAWARHRLAP
jgi:pyridoxamine 5'-phosphate oxidase